MTAYDWMGLVAIVIVILKGVQEFFEKRANTKKTNTEGDLNVVKTAGELQDMMRDLYEKRVLDLETGWKKDKEKIAKLEVTIIEQFAVILQLLSILKSNKIVLPTRLRERVEKIVAAATPAAGLFAEKENEQQ